MAGAHNTVAEAKCSKTTSDRECRIGQGGVGGCRAVAEAKDSKTTSNREQEEQPRRDRGLQSRCRSKGLENNKQPGVGGASKEGSRAVEPSPRQRAQKQQAIGSRRSNQGGVEGCRAVRQHEEQEERERRGGADRGIGHTTRT